ncbi:MAG TPA: hypothetical protein VEL73_06665, partial [Mycobacteriales bacterium]|nr:hypothetical protein [Mycobacteriales bacterium]
AAAEEFGDVLAEGMVAFMHDGVAVTAATQRQWEVVLTQRRQLIADLMSAADRLDAAAAKPIAAALDAAGRRSAEITGFQLAAYVRTWRSDLESWRTRLRGLKRGGSLRAALDTLGLGEWSVLSEEPSSAMVIRIPAEFASVKLPGVAVAG